LIFLLLEFGSFVFDDFHEQLVLKSIRRYCEVDQGHLDADFRQVVRVRKLRRNVEFEVSVVRHFLVTNFNHELALFLYD